MTKRKVLFLYNLLLPLGLLWALPAAIVKMRRRGGYGRGFWQRFGIFERSVERRLRIPQDFWIHAVSVGEVGVARKLVAALEARRPGVRICLSTTTSTGYAVARGWAGTNVTVIYNPLDLLPVADRVFDVVRPRQLVLIEAEVWPNLVAKAVQSGVPVTLVNARVSPRSGRRYRKFKRLVRPLFQMLDRVMVQESRDVAFWEDMGVHVAQISHVGSLKFDQEGASVPGVPESFAAQLESLWGEGVRVLLAASTHDGEEAFVTRVYTRLREQFPDVRLVLVPRHFERAADVVKQVEAHGMSVVRRTEEAVARDDEAVYMVDTTGELSRWMGLAEVVVIGKSFLGKGGQNPVEAIEAGKPVVFGRHMQNFQPLAEELLDAGGAMQADGEAALEKTLARLFESSDLRAGVAAKAMGVLEAHRGACGRAARILLGE